MNNKEKLRIVVGVIIILVVLLVWGLVGSSEVNKIGTTCDLGFNNEGSVFCWKWHRNVVGDIQDRFSEVLNK